MKEIFLSIAGEGAQAGRAMVFCRFSGCNLWSGREQDRQGALCHFCDTDFTGTSGLNGGNYELDGLVARISSVWDSGTAGSSIRKALTFSGGEPALQLDSRLVEKAKTAGFFTCVETNGTLPLPPGLDWVCVSPKSGAKLVVRSGSELKLVFPQIGLEPEDFENLDFANLFIQPKDDGDLFRNQALAAQYCLEHPGWRLSLQIHKILGIR